MNNTALSPNHFDALDQIQREFKLLVGLHANQNDLSKPQALRIVGRETGLSVGTLEGIDRGRIKHVRLSVSQQIRAALLRKLHDIIAQTRHELEIARLVSDRMDAPALTAAESKLAKTIEEAQQILGAK